MTERDDLLHGLRQLIELDRSFGIEFVPRGAALPAAPAPRRVADAPRPAPDVAAVPALVAALTSAAPALAIDDLLAAPPDAALATVATRIAECRACKLCSSRKRTVPGEGSPRPELLFVGEGPGAEEDAQGRPFVGPAGQLLTKMIMAMGFGRDEVFIANVVKCRPPGNRAPEPDEVAACFGYLRAQIAVLKPRVICTLGNTPLRALMGDDKLGITRVRGRLLSFQGIPLIPTFHPSYLLRNPEAKRPCWEDLQEVLKVMGRTPPPRERP